MKIHPKKRNAENRPDAVILKGTAFLVILAMIVLLTGAGSAYVQKNKAHERKCLESLYKRMEIEMAKCAQIGVRMNYAGAELKGELMPMLDVHLYALSNLNQALEDSFGIMYSPLGGHFINKTMNALALLRRDLDAGYPAEKSLYALTECLREMGEILKVWDFQ